jgi:hypothetical protein
MNSDVLLAIHNLTQLVLLLRWYRDGSRKSILEEVLIQFTSH